LQRIAGLLFWPTLYIALYMVTLH